MDRLSIRNQERIPIGRRSVSAHEPYHAVVTTYSKEVTTRPLGFVDEFPTEVVEAIRDGSHSPPLIRSRENAWTSEQFPIVRVPSAELTDLLSELYDYREVQKYTRRATSPADEKLRRQSELRYQPIEKSDMSRDTLKKPPPSYKVTPATPERRVTPSEGISLTVTSSTASDVPKPPLPMYEEYLEEVRARGAREPDDARNNNNNNNRDVVGLRHIDSSTSSSSELDTSSSAPDDDVGQQKRVVYSHDVFVDPNTGKPFSAHSKEPQNAEKLKINVYFSRRSPPPVVPVYQLDEIEIEQNGAAHICKLRPPVASPILPHRSSVRASSSDASRMSALPVKTSILRKEHELVTVPLSRRSQSSVQLARAATKSRKSPEEHAYPKRCGSSEREIPVRVDLDAVFPKMPAPKGHPHPRGTPSEHTQSSTTEKHPTEYVIKNQPKDGLNRAPSSRQSPGELNYGNSPQLKSHFQPRESSIVDLPYTRGISKTPSFKERAPSKSSSSVHIPVYPIDKERAHPRGTSTMSPSVRSSYNEKTQSICGGKSNVSEKAPSVYSRTHKPAPSERTPSNFERPHTHYQPSKPSLPSEKAPSVVYERPSSKSAPRAHSPSSKSLPKTGKGPYEEVVHIKEKYEKEETIRRYYPTTTAV